jgi:hypothetical protein
MAQTTRNPHRPSRTRTPTIPKLPPGRLDASKPGLTKTCTDAPGANRFLFFTVGKTGGSMAAMLKERRGPGSVSAGVFVKSIASGM